MSKEELTEREREIFEETATKTAEHIMEVVQKVLKEKYDWDKNRVMEFLLFVGLEMLNNKGDGKDD